jgi:zinc transport system substrate-binding protein
MRSIHLGKALPLCLLAAVLLVAAVLPGCTNTQPSPPSSAETTVVVTIPPQQEFVERVGGDRVQVVLLVPPGADPHTYEPTPGQLAEVADADMYAAVGSGVEFELAWLDRIASLNPGMAIIDCSEGVDLIASPDGRGTDPHIWLSPRNAGIMVENIYQGLAGVDPGNASYYRRNADTYLLDLDALDKEIAAALKGKENRTIMVYHPSWGYLARDYNLTVIPIESEGKEPAPRDIADLIRQAEEENISVIFASPEFSTRSAQAVAREINATVVLASPLEKNYLENMRRVAGAFARSG